MTAYLIQAGIGVVIAVIGFLLRDKLASIQTKIDENEKKDEIFRGAILAKIEEMRREMIDDYVRKEHCLLAHKDVDNIRIATERAHKRIDELLEKITKGNG